MKKKIFIFFSQFILIILLSVKSWAYNSDPKIFVSELINGALSEVKKNSTDEEKIQNLEKISLETIDINFLGKYVLGKYRKDLKEDIMEEYQEIFQKYFLKEITSRLMNYSDQKIMILDSEVKSEKYTFVKTKLLADSKRPEINIIWRIYTKNPTKPLVRDLIVEGLSMAKAKKAEFNSIISNNDGDVKQLVEKLKAVSSN